MNKLKSIIFFLSISCVVMAQKVRQSADNSPGYDIASYYFPNYHPSDARNNKFKGPGWAEWELVKNAKPRFEGHQQPKVPLWGYTDESDPKAMAQKIDAAADYGVDAFIFDWYYYNDGPFIERGLEEGFMKAKNNSRMKFSLMWANHDWIDIHPAKVGKPQTLLYPGKVTPETFEKMTDIIIERYFKHPSYWKINGAPYFSVYELFRLVESFGGMEATKAALERFREKTKKAGFPDLHMNAVIWGVQILPSETVIKDPQAMVDFLKFNSLTSYVWIHHVELKKFPATPYVDVMNEYFNSYVPKAEKEYKQPYYPNVTMGWDASPRCDQGDSFENRNYPCMATLSGNTPANFKIALEKVKAIVDKKPAGQKIFNINCWNEWTEGSYLEPDVINKFGYLEAIKDVFGKK